MQAIEQMVSEHRRIQQVLDSLAAWADRLAAGAEPDPSRLADYVAFLRGYADAHHHGKEEEIVFAALRRQGCPEEFAAVLAAICRDHETGRNLVDDLEDATAKTLPWSDEVRARTAKAARSFVSLLRRHIDEEDHFVFPQLEELLDARSTKAVEKACARFERDHAARRQEMERLAARLTGR